MINLRNLIDDTRRYETVRELRWCEGMSCAHCDSMEMTKQGRDATQLAQQPYMWWFGIKVSLRRLKNPRRGVPLPREVETQISRYTAPETEGSGRQLFGGLPRKKTWSRDCSGLDSGDTLG